MQAFNYKSKNDKHIHKLIDENFFVQSFLQNSFNHFIWSQICFQKWARSFCKCLINVHIAQAKHNHRREYRCSVYEWLKEANKKYSYISIIHFANSFFFIFGLFFIYLIFFFFFLRLIKYIFTHFSSHFNVQLNTFYIMFEKIKLLPKFNFVLGFSRYLMVTWKGYNLKIDFVMNGVYGL